MVRLAAMEDIAAMVKLLRQQIPETHLKLAPKGFSSRKAANLAKNSIEQGFAWVYDNDDGIHGLLIAQKRLNMFSDTIMEAHMIAIYVKPEYRKGIAAGRLLKSFLSKCEETAIQLTWVGSNIHSSLDEKVITRLGFILQEQFYLKQ